MVVEQQSFILLFYRVSSCIYHVRQVPSGERPPVVTIRVSFRQQLGQSGPGWWIFGCIMWPSLILVTCWRSLRRSSSCLPVRKWHSVLDGSATSESRGAHLDFRRHGLEQRCLVRNDRSHDSVCCEPGRVCIDFQTSYVRAFIIQYLLVSVHNR